MRRPARRLVFVALGLLAVVACSDDPTGPGDPAPVAIEWLHCNLDSVVAEAASDGRDLVVLVTATWCGPCNYFRDSTWTDPRVSAFVARYMTAFELDLTNREDPLCPEGIVIPEVLGEVRGVPMTIILRDGVVIRRIIGYRSPEALHTLLGRTYLDRRPTARR